MLSEYRLLRKIRSLLWHTPTIVTYENICYNSISWQPMFYYTCIIVRFYCSYIFQTKGAVFMLCIPQHIFRKKAHINIAYSIVVPISA